MNNKLQQYMYDASTYNIIQNRKLIKQFTEYVQNTDLHKIHTMIPFFIQEEYYNEKAETTKRNYLVDLKKFCKYIYQHEHVEIPEAIQYKNQNQENNTKQENSKKQTTQYPWLNQQSARNITNS